MGLKNTKITGNKGEEVAVKLLKDKGYKILERNWRVRGGEIDIIAEDHGVLVLVEVKTKIGEWSGTPEEMADLRKIEQVARVGWYYDTDTSRERRIDVVAIVLNQSGETMRITHYKAV